MSGRGTFAGVVFQARVGAYAAAALLAERPLSRLGSGLPGTPKKLMFETLDAVDDILVETDCGVVFIQAKRTITLSSRSDSELASVADQFVRQFRNGVVEHARRRDLDPARDRLLLAVSDAAAGTINHHLRDMFERFRTGAATGLPKNLKSARQIFQGLVAAAWRKETGSAIQPAEMQSILTVCSVTVVGDSQRQIAEEGLRDVVADQGNESTLVVLLESWAATASQDGTGGNVTAIRLALSGKIQLSEPPRYSADVEALLSYSASVIERLKRFAKIRTPEGDLAIPRPVADIVAGAARSGSLAITGEPGSGKSGVLHRVSRSLGKEAAVVTLTVEANAVSLDALEQEIGLEHSLFDVLANMPGDKPAYFILDALDAVRGGPAEATYKQIVEKVSGLDGWHVLASIRTFDLRLGKEWRRIFAGAPPHPEHSNDSFSSVRHVQISLLKEAEIAEVFSVSPTLASAIEAGGRKMEALARNPFNLALLGDLLLSGVAASTLATVKTRGELLSRYWDERIGDLGTPAVVSLNRIVSLMIAARTVDLPETDIPVSSAAMIDELQRVGVLVKEPTRRIGFRHHVLFDYAVARLVLLPDREVAKTHISISSGAGMLISPSLGYWLEDLKKELSPKDFWLFVVSVVSDATADPIIRVEIARLTVESVQSSEDINPLAEVLALAKPSATTAFQHLAGTLLTKAYLKQPIETGPWASLLAKMTNPSDEQIGGMRALIHVLLDNDPVPEAMQSLGEASRTLFDWMSVNDDRIGWLAKHVVPFVAKTYGTDPKASRQRLDQVFETERFNRHGYVEVPSLAEEVLSIAEHDEELTVRLYYCTFRGANFNRDQVTPMSGSWILSLTSNAAQDFDMAKYSLLKSFSDLLGRYPRVALRALSAALRGIREKERAPTEDQQSEHLRIGEVKRDFEADYSHIWAWDIDDNDHDDHAKLYQSAMIWIESVDDNALLLEIPSLILGETNIALAWRVVFDLAAKKPDTLGIAAWRTAADRVALNAEETRHSAINAIAATYPHLSSHDRQQIEEEWLARDFADFRRPEEARRDILGTLFASIGEENLATDAARSFLQEAGSSGVALENKKPFAITSGWPGTDDDDARLTDPLVALTNDLRTALAALKETATLGRGAALWNATLALDQAVEAAADRDPAIDIDVCDALAEGLGHSLARGLVPETRRDNAIARLLKLSHHTHPQSGEDTEKNFADFACWGTLSPRVKAAQSLALLVDKPECWPQIQDSFERLLLDDPHPAVRLKLVNSIPAIGRVDVDTMWRLIDSVAENEQNPAIINSVVSALSQLRYSDTERLEPIILRLTDVEAKTSGDDPVTGLIVFFAINRKFAASKAKLRDWVDHYRENEWRLQNVLVDLRSTLLLGLNGENARGETVRKEALAFIWALIDALEPAVRSWPLSGKEPTLEEVTALKLFNQITDQLFYAVGHDELSAELESDAARNRFLVEYRPLISKLATLGTPRSVYHILQILEKFVDTDPAACFDLFSEAMLRTTGVASYEHESMGAKLFVQLVGRYLADYRSLFDDDERRAKLIDCLALFVEAGWPEARRLFHSLPELLQ